MTSAPSSAPRTTRDPRALPDPFGRTISVLGGTGEQGRGLARRFALAGHPVVLGSRAAERADAAARLLRDSAAGPKLASGTDPEPERASGTTPDPASDPKLASECELAITGADNATAARAGDIVVVAVPWEGHRELLASLAGDLAGKLVVDCVNPLGFDSSGPYAAAVDEGSAAQQAAAVLPESRVVAAFHHVSAVTLLEPTVERVETDVFVLGDDREDTDLIQALAASVPGMRGIYAGRLRNAAQVEAMTANLIAINKRYTAHAGLRVTDV